MHKETFPTLMLYRCIREFQLVSKTTGFKLLAVICLLLCITSAALLTYDRSLDEESRVFRLMVTIFLAFFTAQLWSEEHRCNYRALTLTSFPNVWHDFFTKFIVFNVAFIVGNVVAFSLDLATSLMFLESRPSVALFFLNGLGTALSDYFFMLAVFALSLCFKSALFAIILPWLASILSFALDFFYSRSLGIFSWFNLLDFQYLLSGREWGFTLIAWPTLFIVVPLAFGVARVHYRRGF